jgi:hypothetical protein
LVMEPGMDLLLGVCTPPPQPWPEGVQGGCYLACKAKNY